MEVYKEKIYLHQRLQDTRFGLEPGRIFHSIEEVAEYIKTDYIPKFRFCFQGEYPPIEPLKNMEGSKIKLKDLRALNEGIEATIQTGLNDRELEELTLALTRDAKKGKMPPREGYLITF